MSDSNSPVYCESPFGLLLFIIIISFQLTLSFSISMHVWHRPLYSDFSLTFLIIPNTNNYTSIVDSFRHWLLKFRCHQTYRSNYIALSSVLIFRISDFYRCYLISLHRFKRIHILYLVILSSEWSPISSIVRKKL